MIRDTIGTFLSLIILQVFDFHNGLMGCCEISVLLLWSKAMDLGLTIPPLSEMCLCVFASLLASHLFLPAWGHLEIMLRIESLALYSF